MSSKDRHIHPSSSSSPPSDDSARQEIVAGRYSTIRALLSNPITVGYFLLFCQGQYNSENLNFIMEIDDYRDQFLGDRDMWKKVHWKDVDAEVSSTTTGDEVVTASSWSSIANKVQIESCMQEIYDRYMSDDSPTQIGSSKEIQQRTKQRMKLVPPPTILFMFTSYATLSHTH